jgi:hypothetical protein
VESILKLDEALQVVDIKKLIHGVVLEVKTSLATLGLGLELQCVQFMV